MLEISNFSYSMVEEDQTTAVLATCTQVYHVGTGHGWSCGQVWWSSQGTPSSQYTTSRPYISGIINQSPFFSIHDLKKKKTVHMTVY